MSRRFQRVVLAIKAVPAPLMQAKATCPTCAGRIPAFSGESAYVWSSGAPIVGSSSSGTADRLLQRSDVGVGSRAAAPDR
jgi:hypothetical protein